MNGQTITSAQGTLEVGAGGVASGAITVGGINQVTISGNDACTVFQVDAGVVADLSGLTIMGGKTSNYLAGAPSPTSAP